MAAGSSHEHDQKNDQVPAATTPITLEVMPAAATPSGSRDEDAFVGYNEWAKDVLGVTLCTDFVYDTQDLERGVFIAEDIAPQTEVLRIPFDSLLTLKWLTKQDKHPVYAGVEAFRALRTERALWAIDNEDELLALALVYERWIARDKSPWAPHLCVLPTEYHNLLFFNEEEVALLYGTNMFAMAQHMQAKVRSDYVRLQAMIIPDMINALQQHTQVAVDELEAAFSLEHYLWAISTIWSRFVSVTVACMDADDDDATLPLEKDPSEIKRLKAMAPVFDMLNHDPDAEMSHTFDPTTECFTLVSHQHWSAGAQLYINYGALSNHKLLALYGFVLPENPHDAIEIYMPMDPATTAMFDAKVQALEDHGLQHETTPFELVADELNELLLCTVRIQELEQGMSREAVIAAASHVLEGNVWSRENEVATLTRIIYMLQTVTEVLSSNAENRAATAQPSSLHERMALQLCEGDRALLTENIDMLRWRLLEYLPQIESQ